MPAAGLLKLRCPNCNQTSGAFRLYASTDYISDALGNYEWVPSLTRVVVECLDSRAEDDLGHCKYIGPREEFEDAAKDANNANAERDGTGSGERTESSNDQEQTR